MESKIILFATHYGRHAGHPGPISTSCELKTKLFTHSQDSQRILAKSISMLLTIFDGVTHYKPARSLRILASTEWLGELFVKWKSQRN